MEPLEESEAEVLPLVSMSDLVSIRVHILSCVFSRNTSVTLSYLRNESLGILNSLPPIWIAIGLMLAKASSVQLRHSWNDVELWSEDMLHLMP